MNYKSLPTKDRNGTRVVDFFSLETNLRMIDLLEVNLDFTGRVPIVKLAFFRIASIKSHFRGIYRLYTRLDLTLFHTKSNLFKTSLRSPAL